MFTGIINHLGQFKEFRQGRQKMSISAPQDLVSMLEIGDSLAVNGVCLSVIKKTRDILDFDLSKETLENTNLGYLHRNDHLNLEYPLTLSTPLSGHLVTGHIDGTEKVTKITERKAGRRLSFSLSPDIKPFFIKKGSVALNGVSLTVAKIGRSSFDVEIIPITLKNSNLGNLKRGDIVNIESDMIGKYVYNWMFKNRK
jgi:riboflavin synthase